VVYPVDETPGERGYRYLFYGNGFFINEQGYLVTAAHVLSLMRGGQPHILLQPPAGPPRLVRATLVAVDPDHDVAVLRAAPNPFDGGYKVGFLPLAPAWPAPSRAILTLSIHPPNPLKALTLDALVDERVAGQVTDFQFSQLYKGRDETELILFSPQVRRGQSGAPVVLGDPPAGVGFVEGQWLRSSLIRLDTATDGDSAGEGAAVPIHYVIALLGRKGIAWHPAPAVSSAADGSSNAHQEFSPPVPLSLVACPFPSQSIFGGEVVLDALIDAQGRLADTDTIHRESPFIESALRAVRTWSFTPARAGGQPVEARVGIIFQFVQSHDPLRAPQSERPSRAPAEPSSERLSSPPNRGALPAVTSEARFPPTAARDGHAILFARITGEGHLSSLEVVQDRGSFAPAAQAAVEKWQFAPGRRAGTDSDSAVIVVVVFRYSGNPPPAPPSR